ncbi:MAG: 5'-nucleotidase C-terminal domain-containing protein [Eubacteriales bacterium]|nr:5'-nucleotidase C-terminal domain-containing protein [Eubacteriales bacterium]
MKGTRRIAALMTAAVVAFTTTAFVQPASATVGVRGNARHEVLPDSKPITYGEKTVTFTFTGNVSDPEDFARVASFGSQERNKYGRYFQTDTGNLTMSIPYKLLNSSGAPIETLGAAGYDFASFGSTEYSWGSTKLSSMLGGAVSSGSALPYINAANVKTDSKLSSAFANYGVNDYTKIDKYNADVAIFSLVSRDAYKKAKKETGGNSKLKFEDPVQAAKRVVGEINSESQIDFVICVCESGTGGSDKDKKLEKAIADAVSGIDIIVSTGSSTERTDPIERNGARIVSLPNSGKKILRVKYSNPGRGTIRRSYSYASTDSVSISDYKKDAEALKTIQALEKKADSKYFGKYGFSFRDELTESFFKVYPVAAKLEEHKNPPSGELIADAYRYSAIHDGKVAKANLITAASDDSLKGTLGKGHVTAGDVFELMTSNGSYSKGTGSTLVSFFVTGEDISNIAKIAANDAGVKGKTQLIFGGLTYKYNPKRGANHELYDLAMSSDDNDSGMGDAIDPNKLYRIVTDHKTAAYIAGLTYDSSADGSSEKVVLRDKSGAEVTEPTELPAVTTMKSIKAWQAVASYFKTFGSTGIPAVYKKADNRFTYTTTTSFLDLIRGQVGSFVVLLISLFLGVLALLTLIWLIRGMMKKPERGGRQRK